MLGTLAAPYRACIRSRPLPAVIDVYHRPLEIGHFLTERGLKPATTSVPKRISELVVAGLSPRWVYDRLRS